MCWTSVVAGTTGQRSSTVGQSAGCTKKQWSNRYGISSSDTDRVVCSTTPSPAGAAVGLRSLASSTVTTSWAVCCISAASSAAAPDRPASADQAGIGSWCPADALGRVATKHVSGRPTELDERSAQVKSNGRSGRRRRDDDRPCRSVPRTIGAVRQRLRCRRRVEDMQVGFPTVDPERGRDAAKLFEAAAPGDVDRHRQVLPAAQVVVDQRRQLPRADLQEDADPRLVHGVDQLPEPHRLDHVPGERAH